MKKNIIIAALAAATALFVSASCTKQDTDLQAVSGAKVFTASIEQVQTKTSLGAYAGKKNVIFWDKRDSILINKETFYSAEPNSEKPMLAEFLHCGGPEPKAPYEAIFPASLYVDNDYLQAYCFPQVQTYRAGKFNAPMYAYDENRHLMFYNICGVICFSLKGTEKIRSIELTSKTKYINGVFKIVDESKEDYTAVIDATAGEFYDYNRIVTLDCGENGVQLSKTDSTNFFIYLPETSFAAEDLSVRVTTAEGKWFEKTASNSVTVKKNTVYTFNWEVDATVQNTLANFFKGLSEDQVRLAAATDEAMRPLSEEEIANINANPAKAKQIFLPEIHTWSNARPAILAIEESLAKIDENYNFVNLMGLTKSELLFLEGYLYFELARTYGQAPPILSLPGHDPAQPVSLTEFMDFIVNNAEEAINCGEWSKEYDQGKKTIELAEGIEMTRPTRLAARALEGRTFLYFASPLFNQSGGDNSKWEKAAAFFKEIIDNGAFSLASEYTSSWNLDSPELIFGVKFTQANDAYAGIHPTQSMVDGYRISAGDYFAQEPIDFEETFGTIDPRCSFTINIPTTDGYTLKKPMSTFLPVFRYADILLSLAEATIALQHGDQATIDQTVNQVRNRAKMPNFTTAVNQDDIEHERLAEFAFEGHRFWDVRRWMKGYSYFGTISAADVRDENGKLVGYRVPISLPWNDEYNFYPTPW